MDKIKKMWRNLSLRKSIILYISAFVILAILLSAGTATLCNNATLQIALMKIQGYSTREIAVYLDITEKAVYRRMDRLKEKLKKLFE